MSVPSKAPMSETRLPKLGTALAMMYAMMTTAEVHDSQVIQCVTVFAVRCLEPRRMRTKRCLAGSCQSMR